MFNVTKGFKSPAEAAANHRAELTDNTFVQSLIEASLSCFSVMFLDCNNLIDSNSVPKKGHKRVPTKY